MSERNCENHIVKIPSFDSNNPIQPGVCDNCGEMKMFDTTPPPITIGQKEMRRQYLLQGLKTPYGRNADVDPDLQAEI